MPWSKSENSSRRTRLPFAINRLATVPLAVLLAGATPQGEPTNQDVPRAAYPSVENILELEALWPYRVKLTREWKPVGEERALRASTPGVLIRIEESGLARIDFSAGGVHTVPVDHTDLIERANAIRRNDSSKRAANYAHAIGPRLIDVTTQRVADMVEISSATGFLSVAADPNSSDFPELAKRLRSLESLNGFRTVLFPIGESDNDAILTTLEREDWPISFVMEEYSEAYARGLMSSMALPRFALHSPQGRLLLESQWTDTLPTDLSEAIRSYVEARKASARAPTQRTAD
jgi:hypothetical protein